MTTIHPESVQRLVSVEHENPFELLGPHAVREGRRNAVAVRAYLPQSQQAWIVDPANGGSRRPMKKIHPEGLYEAVCPWPKGVPEREDQSAQDSTFAGQYLINFADQSGIEKTMHDPYSFPSLLTEYDLYLLGEGTHYDAYNRLGAHPRNINGVEGVNFAVWAPNARSVSLIGDFNEWDGRRHQMRKLIPSGIWELFVPGLPV